MAGPLHAFRKHQKKLLVVFGIGIMFTFVVGGSLMKYLDSGGSGRPGVAPVNNKLVVVTWKNDKNKTERVTVAKMQEMQFLHERTANFLSRVSEETREKKGVPKAKDLTRGSMMPASEEGLLLTVMLASRAEKLGFVVDDEIISLYLQEFCDNKLSDDDMVKIVEDVFGNKRGEKDLFQWLRQIMLADAAQGVIASDMGSQTPAESWQYYNRLQRRVAIEILPIPVADFKEKVKGPPTESQVSKLYKEHKEDYSFPDDPTPGFRKRPKRQFRYVVLDRQRFIDAEKAKVSDEQVKEHYEANKDNLFVAIEPSEPSQDDKNNPEPEQKKDSADPDKTKKETPAKKDDPAPKPPTKKGDDPKKPANDKAKSPDAAPKKDDSSTNVPTKAADQVALPSNKSFFVNADDDSEKPKGQEDKPKTPSAKENPKTDDNKSNPAERKKPPKKEVKYTPLEEVEDDIRFTLAEKSADKLMEEAGKLISEELNAYSVLHGDDYSLWRDNETAVEKMKPAPKKPKPLTFVKLVDQYEATVVKLSKQYQLKVNESELELLAEKYKAANDQANLKKVSRLLKAVKQTAMLKLVTDGKEMPLLDNLEIGEQDDLKGYKYELAKGVEPKFFRTPNGGFDMQQLPFNQVAYQQELGFCAPNQIRPGSLGGSSGISFIYWKIDEKNSYIPEFKDVRQQVEDAWYLLKTRQLAKTDAELKVKEASKSGKTLTEIYADKVLNTHFFSWMTSGSIPGSFQRTPKLEISKVTYLENPTEGVDFPGNGFMKAVFALREGEVGYAFNQPEQVVYVFRLSKEEQTEAELVERFLEDPKQQETFSLYQNDLGQRQQQWSEQFYKEMQVEWSVSP